MIKTIKNQFKKFIVDRQICTPNITLMAAVFLVLIFLGATSFLYMRSPSTIAYKQELEKSFRQENARGEWNRLYTYHGYPRVVDEESQEP
jgi:hypothetical protein